MSDFHPEHNGYIVIHPMAAGGSTISGINISLKQAQRCFIYCEIEQGADATQTTFTLAQSSGNAGSAAGTGEKAMSANVPIFYNENCATNNVLSAATAAKSYQTDTGQSRTKLVVFDIEPAVCMDLANNFDCITCNATDPGAANICGIKALIVPERYSPLATVFAD